MLASYRCRYEEQAMKFGWFHLMPYRELPPDFAEKHRSVWVDVPSSLFDPARAHEMYHDYLDELEFAAHAGFDGICVNEHHQNAYGLMPSPNIMAATLTRRTKDAAIVVLGNSVALWSRDSRWGRRWTTPSPTARTLRSCGASTTRAST
jgi:hypothetical protein